MKKNGESAVALPASSVPAPTTNVLALDASQLQHGRVPLFHRFLAYQAVVPVEIQLHLRAACHAIMLAGHGRVPDRNITLVDILQSAGQVPAGVGVDHG